MYHKTEQEIMKNWKSDILEPIVSICCTTYNHELYIEDALQGFLKQDSDFPFEILIRDDCSTDKTALIVKKYAEKYPNIIKPLYEKENTFSKGVKPMPQLFKIAKGKYIALCEGDDYWTDPKKLQIQIDEMQKYTGVDISFHPAWEVIDGKMGKKLAKHINKNKIFTTSEIILGDGDFCPTASLMVRKKAVMNFLNWLTEEIPVGDFFLQIFGSLKGGALYINKEMCIYRREHSGSWSAGLKDIEELKRRREQMTIAMKLLNEELKFKYDEEINIYNSEKNYLIFMRNIAYPLLYRKKLFTNHKEYLSLKQKLLWYVVFSRPFIHRTLNKTVRPLLLKLREITKRVQETKDFND